MLPTARSLWSRLPRLRSEELRVAKKARASADALAAAAAVKVKEAERKAAEWKKKGGKAKKYYTPSPLADTTASSPIGTKSKATSTVSLAAFSRRSRAAARRTAVSTADAAGGEIHPATTRAATIVVALGAGALGGDTDVPAAVEAAQQHQQQQRSQRRFERRI
jgi:hypothetical protein